MITDLRSQFNLCLNTFWFTMSIQSGILSPCFAMNVPEEWQTQKCHQRSQVLHSFFSSFPQLTFHERLSLVLEQQICTCRTIFIPYDNMSDSQDLFNICTCTSIKLTRIIFKLKLFLSFSIYKSENNSMSRSINSEVLKFNLLFIISK